MYLRAYVCVCGWKSFEIFCWHKKTSGSVDLKSERRRGRWTGGSELTKVLWERARCTVGVEGRQRDALVNFPRRNREEGAARRQEGALKRAREQKCRRNDKNVIKAADEGGRVERGKARREDSAAVNVITVVLTEIIHCTTLRHFSVPHNFLSCFCPLSCDCRCACECEWIAVVGDGVLHVLSRAVHLTCPSHRRALIPTILFLVLACSRPAEAKTVSGWTALRWIIVDIVVTKL